MAKKRRVENKSLQELGKKSRSGQVLSQYIRAIATEQTELIIDPETGKSKVVSKGEALARKMWLTALGYVFDPSTEKYIETGELSLEWVKALLDRAEGKVGVGGDDPNADRVTAAERVSEVNKDRLNTLADGGEDGGGV